MQSRKENFLVISKWMWLFLAANMIVGFYAANKIKLFGIPDESAHYFRALEVSRGVFINTVENSGILISCEEYKLAGTANGPIFGYIDVDEMARLNPEKPCLIRTLNTAGVYSPVMYMFSAVGIKISEIIDGSYKAKHYTGRIFNVVGNSIIIFMSLCLISHCRHLMAAISLAPLVFWLRSSLSADAVTISACFFFICLLLRFVEKNHVLNARRIMLLSAAAVFVGATKPLVSLLPFAAVILWNSGTVWAVPRRFFLLILPGLLSIVTAYGFASAANPSLVHIPSGSSPSEQLIFILQNLLGFADILLRTLQNGLCDWVNQVVGAMNTIPYLLIIALLAITSTSVLGPVQRVVFLLIAIGMSVEAGLALYLAYTPVGHYEVYGLQGRLFVVPFMIGILAVTFENKKLLYIGPSARNFMAYILPFIIIIRSHISYMPAFGL